MVGGAARQELRLQGEFLSLLYRTKRRLPERAQYRPHADVYAEAHFYYEREALPGVCVFCDGPDHDQPERKSRDKSERARLGDLGYRVIVIRYDQALDEQINAHVDIFGPGL